MAVTPIQQLIETWRRTDNIVFGAFAKELEAAYTGSFAWAMGTLLTVPGAKVRRKGWDVRVSNLCRNGSWISHESDHPDDPPYGPDMDDLAAKDWVLVEEAKP
jgi:hypothetical protein